MVGAGSFGTAVAVLLARGGFRTTLQTRTQEHADQLFLERVNVRYLPEVVLPKELKTEPASEGLAKADYVFLGVPSRGLDEIGTVIVDGKTITMGQGPWAWDAKQQTLTFGPKERVCLISLHEDRLDATLTLADGTIFRRMSLTRDVRPPR